jgi:hypothetical protein
MGRPAAWQVVGYTVFRDFTSVSDARPWQMPPDEELWRQTRSEATIKSAIADRFISSIPANSGLRLIFAKMALS